MPASAQQQGGVTAPGSNNRIPLSATPPATCTVGMLYFRTATSIGLNQCTATNTWTSLAAAGSGAPTDATYITKTANSSLSAEQALGALASGIMLNATTTGTVTVIADGAAGAFLATDGAGAFSFTTPATTPANDIKFNNGKGVKTNITTSDTMLMQAYDVNDTTYRTFGTLTAGNTPSFALAAPSGGTLSGNFTTLQIGGVSVGASSSIDQLGITIDGAGSTITTGAKGFIVVPYACTITQVTLLSTDAAITSGSIVIDIWKDTYANYAPTVADTITASAKPTITTATKSQDSTLTGWTTSVAAGDVLGFNVDSVTSLTRVTLILKVTIN